MSSRWVNQRAARASATRNIASLRNRRDHLSLRPENRESSRSGSLRRESPPERIAKRLAQQAAGQAQEKLRAQIDRRSAQAAEQINEQASDLRSVSEALRNQGKDGPAKAADRLAGYAERVGGYLSEKDSEALLADAEEFGRRRPWAAAAGGLALGVAASRFLKASSRQRYASQSRRQLPPPRPSAPSPDILDESPASTPRPSSAPPLPGAVAPIAPGV
jgi:hypothetical protein